MLEQVKQGVLSKFPLLGSVMAKLIFTSDDRVETAETNGKQVKYSPSFLSKLSFEERMFLLAHEVMHVAFDHVMRSRGKDEKRWNIATDAVINQMLLEANLPLPQGGVNLPEAKGKSADEVYEMLAQDKQNQNQNPQQHQAWGDAVKQQGQQGQDDTQTQDGNAQASQQEKLFTAQNQTLKKKLAEKIRQELKQASNEAKEGGQSAGGNGLDVGKVGEAKAVVSWKQILRRELEQDEDRWSYRRADEDNDYQARIGTVTNDDKAIVEVMLDTSSSVSEDMLRAFLRQVKHLAKDSKLLVGCFDTRFYGFDEIKKTHDIEYFDIVGRGGTNFDIALENFSHDRKVNKIVFTDGFADVSNTPENQKIKNLYWLVWANDVFKPCCGKVIFVDRQQINYSQHKLTTCRIQPNSLGLRRSPANEQQLSNRVL